MAASVRHERPDRHHGGFGDRALLRVVRRPEPRGEIADSRRGLRDPGGAAVHGIAAARHGHGGTRSGAIRAHRVVPRGQRPPDAVG